MDDPWLVNLQIGEVAVESGLLVEAGKRNSRLRLHVTAKKARAPDDRDNSEPKATWINPREFRSHRARPTDIVCEHDKEVYNA